MDRRVLRACVFLLVVAALVASVAVRTAAQEPTPPDGGLLIGPSPTPTSGLVIGPGPLGTPATGVNGTAYLSPTYGYGLSWDPAWRVTDAGSAGGVDRLTLTDGASTIAFTASPATNQSPADCLATLARQLGTQPGVQGLATATNGQGQPLTGGDAGRAWGVYLFARAAAGGAAQAMAAYLECRLLGRAPAVLTIVDLVPGGSAPFNAEVPALQALLARLVVPGGVPTPVTGPTQAPAPTAAPAATTAPVPTTPPAPAGCDGAAAWLAATVARLDHADQILTAFESLPAPQTATDVASQLEQGAATAAELAGLAQAQAGAPVPAAAAAANGQVIGALTALADVLNRLVTVLSAPPITTQTVSALVQEERKDRVAFGAARGAVTAVAVQCGLPVATAVPTPG